MGPDSIADLANRRHGIVTAGDLSSLGMSRYAVRRWAQSGYLRTVHRGVYCVGDDLLSVRGHWMALVRSFSFAALSHVSAAQLRGLAAPRLPIAVTVPVGRAGARDGARVFQSRHLDPPEIEHIDSIPVTSLPRTLLDVASVAGQKELERLTAEAQRQGVLCLDELHAFAAAVRFRKGAPALRRLLGALDPGEAAVRSGGERDLLRLVSESVVIPMPEVNVMVGPYEVDFLWRRERVIVELDGYRYHRDFLTFERDHERNAYLAKAGYEVVRISYRMVVDQPEAVLASIRAVLKRRGGRFPSTS